MKKQSKPKSDKEPCLRKGQVDTRKKRNGNYTPCDSHHLRELTRAWEQEGQLWAKEIKNFLEALNTVVAETGGVLSASRRKKYRVQYSKLLKKANIECLEPSQFLKKGLEMEIKKSRSRNLLDRLNAHKDHILMD